MKRQQTELTVVASGIAYAGWVLAAVFVLVLLFLPDSWFLRFSRSAYWEQFSSQQAMTLLVLYSIALIVVALLLYSGLQLFDEWQKRGESESGKSQRLRTLPARLLTLLGALGVLLLARTLYNLYWFMIWDTTTDPLGYLWLFIPVSAVLLTGLGLCIALPGRKKWAGFVYALLIPALLIGVCVQAQHVNFRELTEARAERISQALTKYFVQEGQYPQDLQQLTPWPLRSLAQPVIIYGQDWCYQGGETFYRFGYLDREHWSHPILFGHLYSAQGDSTLTADVCQREIVAFQAQHPDWGRVLQAFGRPTPAPDFGG